MRILQMMPHLNADEADRTRIGRKHGVKGDSGIAVYKVHSMSLV